jgi:hypothetical protein
MTTNTAKERTFDLNTFKTMCLEHDWYYDFSDDNRVWEAGKKNQERIVQYLKGLEDLGLREEALLLFASEGKHEFMATAGAAQPKDAANASKEVSEGQETVETQPSLKEKVSNQIGVFKENMLHVAGRYPNTVSFIAAGVATALIVLGTADSLGYEFSPSLSEMRLFEAKSFLVRLLD